MATRLQRPELRLARDNNRLNFLRALRAFVVQSD